MNDILRARWVSQLTIAAIGAGHGDLSCPAQAHALLSAASLGRSRAHGGVGLWI